MGTRPWRSVLLTAVAAGTLVALGSAAAAAEASQTAACASPSLTPRQAGQFVYDLGHLWRQTTIDSAQSTVAAVRARSEADIEVVSWPTGRSAVDSYSARTDAATIMNTWGVGREAKPFGAGLVVLFDLDSDLQVGQIVLATGSGFQDEYLDDAEAQAIVDQDMLPRTSSGDPDGALIAGLAKVDQAVQPGGNPSRPHPLIPDLVQELFLLAIAAGVLVLVPKAIWPGGRMFGTRGPGFSVPSFRPRDRR